MVDKTRNGFPVITPADTSKRTTFEVAGHKVTTAKSSAALFERWITFLNVLEPIAEAGYDGSYAYRDVRGTTGVWSEHAAGMAYDHNAAQHPRGAEATAGWSSLQVKMIRWGLKHTAMGKCLKWGADFHGTKDAMHFEVLSPAVLADYNAKHGK